MTTSGGTVPTYAMQLILLVIAFALLPACAPGPNTPDPATRVSLDNGDLIGFSHRDDTYAWLGIPYAEPPLGELRWRAPRPPDDWEGTLEAVGYGPACVQPPNPTAGPNAPESERVVGVEDCLTINVIAPRSVVDSARPLPVMFWIHGGANLVGSAQYYDGAEIAQSQGVVFVSLNYRLGMLGWFRHAALREGITAPADKSGNYGTLDIIAGLRWVQNNISRFGGDPNRVTVFGESAGGKNTWSMVLSPLAKGMFQRAIVQSGSLRLTDPDKAESIDPGAIDYPSYRNNSSELVERLLGESAPDDLLQLRAALQGATPDEIYGALEYLPVEGMYEQARLFLDGFVFPKPAFEALQNPMHYNAVPIITGSNRDEDRLFMQFNPRWTDTTLGVFSKVKDPERYVAAAAYGADTWRALAVDEPARIIAANGGAPVYTYRFDFDELASWPSDYSLLIGASHAMEIPFVFGSQDEFPWTLLFASDEQRAALSTTMMDHWGAFAHRGSPNAPSLTKWPPLQAAPGHIMVFDSEADGGVRLEASEMSSQQVKARLAEDQRFDQREKCSTYYWQFLNGFQDYSRFDVDEFASFGEGGCTLDMIDEQI